MVVNKYMLLSKFQIPFKIEKSIWKTSAAVVPMWIALDRLNLP